MSRPDNPVRVTTFPVAGATDGAQVVGNTLYLASERFFHVVEIAMPLRLDATVLPGNRLELSWRGASGVRLQETTSLANPGWQDLPDSEGQSSLELPMTKAMAFFRLVQR